MFFSPTLEKTVKINGLSHYPYGVHTNIGTASQVPYTQRHTYSPHTAHVRNTHPHRDIHSCILRDVHTGTHSEICTYREVHTHMGTHTGTHREAFAIRHMWRR